MTAKLGFTKRALVLGGLLIGTAGVALAPSVANARNFIGVDVGPLSVGIGANEPDSDAAPAPSTTYVAPSTSYAAPSTTYVEPAPQTYVETPPAISQAPVTTEAPVTTQAPVATDHTRTTTETTTRTYYNYPNETTTYEGYQPRLAPRGSETTTIYYPPQ